MRRAALDPTCWMSALEGVARATGSKAGQLIGAGAAAMSFSLISDVPADVVAEFAQAGAGDPRINSRLRIGTAVSELTILDERDFTTEADKAANPEYGASMERNDVPFICLTPLVRERRQLIGLSVLRGARHGNIADEQRRAFALIAAHAQSAVRTQLAVEGRGIALMHGVLDAIDAAALICDPAGRILAMSQRAETLLHGGRQLRATHARLSAAATSETRLLEAAIDRAAAALIELSPPPPLVLRGTDMADPPLHIEVSTLPSAVPFFRPVLVVARHAGADLTRLAGLAQGLFGLTLAESHIAARIASGAGADAIARDLGIGTGTVRTHIRRILEKAEVRSQIEFVAKLTLR